MQSARSLRPTARRPPCVLRTFGLPPAQSLTERLQTRASARAAFEPLQLRAEALPTPNQMDVLEVQSVRKLVASHVRADIAPPAGCQSRLVSPLVSRLP